jgi:hypothetical protein
MHDLCSSTVHITYVIFLWILLKSSDELKVLDRKSYIIWLETELYVLIANRCDTSAEVMQIFKNSPSGVSKSARYNYLGLPACFCKFCYIHQQLTLQNYNIAVSCPTMQYFAHYSSRKLTEDGQLGEKSLFWSAGLKQFYCIRRKWTIYGLFPPPLTAKFQI